MEAKPRFEPPPWLPPALWFPPPWLPEPWLPEAWLPPPWFPPPWLPPPWFLPCPMIWSPAKELLEPDARVATYAASGAGRESYRRSGEGLQWRCDHSIPAEAGGSWRRQPRAGRPQRGGWLDAPVHAVLLELQPERVPERIVGICRGQQPEGRRRRRRGVRVRAERHRDDGHDRWRLEHHWP